MRLDLEQLNAQFETATTLETLVWAWETLGPKIAAISSSQTQSVPLLHMIAQATLQMPVFFLDTGFHFPETLLYRDRLIETLNLNAQALTPELGHDGFRMEYGDLYRRDPNRCCYLNKVEPLSGRCRACEVGSAACAGTRRPTGATRPSSRKRPMA